MFTYCSENHVQWHRYVKVKGVIVAHADCKEHQDQVEVVLQSDAGLFPTAFVSNEKSLDCNEGEL